MVAQPHVSETEIGTDDDAILVLACDGVFDVMTDEQVAEWVYRENKELKMKGPRTSSSDDAAAIAQVMLHSWNRAFNELLGFRYVIAYSTCSRSFAILRHLLMKL